MFIPVLQCHYSYSDCGLGSDGTDRLVQLVQEMQHNKVSKFEDGTLYGAKITGGGSGGTVCVIGRNCLRSSQQILEVILFKHWNSRIVPRILLWLLNWFIAWSCIPHFRALFFYKTPNTLCWSSNRLFGTSNPDSAEIQRRNGLFTSGDWGLITRCREVRLSENPPSIPSKAECRLSSKQLQLMKQSYYRITSTATRIIEG